MSKISLLFFLTKHSLHFFAAFVFSIGLFAYWDTASASSEEPVLHQNESVISAKNFITSKVDFTEYKEPVKPRDPRAIRLEKYLRSQKSSLSSQSDLLVELSDHYGIDYKLVVAIAGLESGYCSQNFAANNCWGFGNYSWSSREIAVKEYYRLMYKNYFKKGMNTIEEIFSVYAPGSTTYLQSYYYHYNRIP